MDQALSAEQVALGRTVREFIERKSSEEAVRVAVETDYGFDRGLWMQMVEMLGLAALIIPEEYDGVGGNFTDLGVVVREMGRALVPSPFFGTVVLGVNALLLSGDEAAMSKYLPEIAGGARTATVAIGEADGTWEANQISTRAVDEGGWHLTGTKERVIDGDSADLILVLASTDAGELGFFVVDRDAAGIERVSLSSLDLTTRAAHMSFSATPATLIGTLGDGERVAAALLNRAAILTAAEQLGGMEMLLETAVAYAKERYQFGRAIGSFQAIKHRCADMLISVSRAQSGTRRALWALDNAPEEVSVDAFLLKAYCSDAYFKMATSNIALHGGIGYTWEHSAHLYYRRAKSSQMRFGSPGYFREKLMSEVLV